MSNGKGNVSSRSRQSKLTHASTNVGLQPDLQKHQPASFSELSGCWHCRRGGCPTSSAVGKPMRYDAELKDGIARVGECRERGMDKHTSGRASCLLLLMSTQSVTRNSFRRQAGVLRQRRRTQWYAAKYTLDTKFSSCSEHQDWSSKSQRSLSLELCPTQGIQSHSS